MNLENNSVTVLTATFNRSQTLPRLYESLCRQSDSNFNWIIVDDGSVDETAEYVNFLINENRISIKYVVQPNSGKHVAINNGVKNATGQWIFIVDSDDLLTDDAIKKIRLQTFRKQESKVVGLCFRKAHMDGYVIGVHFANEESICMSPTAASKYFKGDLAYVFKADALIKNPFPTFKKEKFVPELYIWNRIGDLGKIVFFPSECIYLCEYLPDGYSANFKKNLRANPKGFYKFYSTQISRESLIRNKAKNIVRCIQCIFYASKNAFLL